MMLTLALSSPLVNLTRVISYLTSQRNQLLYETQTREEKNAYLEVVTELTFVLTALEQAQDRLAQAQSLAKLLAWPVDRNEVHP